MVNFSGFPGSAMKSTKACAQNLYCKENAHPRPQEAALAEKAFEEDQQTKSETPQKIHPQDVQCGEI